MRHFINLVENAQLHPLPLAGQTPWWVAPLMPLTAEIKRTWGRQWSWVTGGCFAFAETLHAAYGGELWGVCSHVDAGDDLGDDYPVEHAMLRINGHFYDFTGVVDTEAYMAMLKKEKAKARIPVTITLKPKSDPEIFWFEDDYLDDDQMSFLMKVLSGKVA